MALQMTDELTPDDFQLIFRCKRVAPVINHHRRGSFGSSAPSHADQIPHPRDSFELVLQSTHDRYSDGAVCSCEVRDRPPALPTVAVRVSPNRPLSAALLARATRPIAVGRFRIVREGGSGNSADDTQSGL
jgi:hypothetical protein